MQVFQHMLLLGMTHRSPIRSLALSACLAALLSTPTSLAAEPLADLHATSELSRVDVRGTAASITAVLQAIQQLEPEARAEAIASLRYLSVNCPYTRAALQLPFALHARVKGIDAETLDPFIARDWRTLQEGLATHVAVLEALEVDLALPPSLDATREVVQAIPTAATAIDEETMYLIELRSEQLEAATGIGRPCPRGPWSIQPGHPWTLGLQLGGWSDALRRLRPFVKDPATGKDIDAMRALLDDFATHSMDG